MTEQNLQHAQGEGDVRSAGTEDRFASLTDEEVVTLAQDADGTALEYLLNSTRTL
jgi:hypothetical protein